MFFKRHHVLLFPIVIMMTSVSLFAQTTESADLPHFKINYFTTDNGLPGNALVAAEKDHRGYLWVGGFEGLIRFDGTRFVTFDPTTSQIFKSSQISSLKLDQNGTLWIGTGQGLIKYEDGKFINLATPNFSFYIESIAIDHHEQVIWLGTRNSGLYKYDIRANSYTRIENKFAHDIITCIALDNSGGIWVASEKNGFAHHSNGQWKYYTKADGLASNEITWLHTEGENLYICTILGLNILRKDAITKMTQISDSRVSKVKSDPEGNLWVLTTSGIHILYKSGVWRMVSKQNGLSVNDIRDVCFDDYGSIWLATYRGGLNQLIEERFITLTASDGLPVEATSTVYQLGENKFIAGSTDGKLFIIENKKGRPFVIQHRLNKPICEIMKDHLGNLWFATYDGLLLITSTGKEMLFTESDGLPTRQLRSIIQDKNKNYWIGSRTSGIIKMEFNERTSRPAFTKAFSERLSQANATFVISMTLAPDGNLLIATSGGSIVKVFPDGSIKQYGTKAGQPGEVAFSARVDANGTIWAASAHGLSRISDSSVINFSKAEGIPHETVYDVVEDALGYLWMPCTRGIIKVKKSELESYIRDKNTNIQWRMYDKNDDLVEPECTGASRIFKDTSGHLWFPVLDGLVTVDPKEIQVDSKAPEISIEKLIVDDNPIDLSKEIVLPPGSNRFVVSYSGISLKYQEAIRYKYKIENFDRDWIIPGNETQAVYTSLPAGNYVFRVTACNKDGVCNTVGASFSFTIQHYYYESKWFYVLIGFFLIAAAMLYTRLRTRAMRRRTAELQILVEQRTHEIAEQRDELIVLNEELQSSEEEVMAQRDSLAEKNIEIERINVNLEKIVAERTEALEERNKKLEEYAFINAHKLRGPLARILGIIHLLETETDIELRKKMLELLLIASNDLDAVIHSINKMLEEGDAKTFEERLNEEKEKPRQAH